MEEEFQNFTWVYICEVKHLIYHVVWKQELENCDKSQRLRYTHIHSLY